MDGFDIMFIGIITEKVLRSLKLDDSIGTFVGLEDAVAKVGKICNAYFDNGKLPSRKLAKRLLSAKTQRNTGCLVLKSVLSAFGKVDGQNVPLSN